MADNVTRKLIADHLLSGRMTPGEEIALRIDQTLTQDATGTLAMLEFEAMGIGRVRTELSAQYVDHNLLQLDYRNADDHLFLASACRKFGIWFSPPGNGVSHPVHMEYFGRPGKTLLGSDSHSCAAGALGMLAIGAGGLEVALAMAGEPFHVRMPEVWGVKLVGRLPDWVSAKDVILEMLRRHGVAGGVGRVVEYHGPGLANLSAMDRHVIANMGAELGATSTVFPSDDAVRRFLRRHGREDDWCALTADDGADYEFEDEIDLGTLEPLIACPSSPGNVVPVAEVAGRPIYQAYIGSSANPGLRDFAVPAMMVDGRRIDPRVSFDVNPTSRRILGQLMHLGYLEKLLTAGARLHQTGCNGCIGMGQAPATGRISLRTVPRNFPGRSGTREDQVYLCSPETAVASALAGEIVDPRSLGLPCPRFEEPDAPAPDPGLLVAPADDGADIELVKGPNIRPLPECDPLPDALEGPVLLKAGDDVSTDEIMPAGAEVLPLRSNIPAIARFAFSRLDPDFAAHADACDADGFFVVAGTNYGQGSSREHAAIAPRHLGLRAVVAKSFARIHWQNLVNFGILPLTFADPSDHARIEQDDLLALRGLDRRLRAGEPLTLVNTTRNERYEVCHTLSERQLRILRDGGVIRHIARQCAAEDEAGAD
ncbi:MAG TPA: aconitate hydratase [Rhodocyclaceae bacterium]|nr:aconitate hydratase [Rhodocyclaceae bacterium]